MQVFAQYGHWSAGKSGRQLLPHTNPGLELVYVANGIVRWDYDGVEVTVPAGYLSYSWPWQVHGAQDVTLPAVDLYWILIPLRGPSLAEKDKPFLSSDLGLEEDERGALMAAMRAQELPVLRMSRDFRVSFTRLVKRLITHGGNYDMESRGLFLLSMAQLQMSLESAILTDELPAKQLRVATFWQQELSLLVERPWTLDDMASYCGMGRSAFAEYTKRLYGDTPIRMLTRTRLELARTLLENSERSITEIAFRCGFNSSQTFATTFKAYYGQTPSSCVMK